MDLLRLTTPQVENLAQQGYDLEARVQEGFSTFILERADPPKRFTWGQVRWAHQLVTTRKEGRAEQVNPTPV